MFRISCWFRNVSHKRKAKPPGRGVDLIEIYEARAREIDKGTLNRSRNQTVTEL